MDFSFDIESVQKTGGRCAACRKDFAVGDFKLGCTAVFEGKPGTMMYRHERCALSNQIRALLKTEGGVTSIKGWSDLTAETQTTIEEQLSTIAEGKKKSSKRKKVNDENGSAKKPRTPKAAKEKKEKKEKTPKGEKKVRKKKDPNAPKGALTSFFLFLSKRRPEFKIENPGVAAKEMTTTLALEWKELTAEQKQVYIDLNAKDKIRYQRQMKEFDDTGKFTPADEMEEEAAEEKAGEEEAVEEKAEEEKEAAEEKPEPMADVEEATEEAAKEEAAEEEAADEEAAEEATEPAAEEAAAAKEEPVTEEAAKEEPVAEEAATEKAATEEAATEEAATEEPAAEEAAKEEPVAEKAAEEEAAPTEAAAEE